MPVSQPLTAVIRFECDGYVSICPELDIASQGDTIEEAGKNLVEALALFIESAAPSEIAARLRQNSRLRSVRVRARQHWSKGLSEEERIRKLEDLAHHIVHDYANLVSSAELALAGRHNCRTIDPPVNTHIKHAFLLNSRKMRDFFTSTSQGDDVVAMDYLGECLFTLPAATRWKKPIDKQLAHLTVFRLDSSEDIDRRATEQIYNAYSERCRSAFRTDADRDSNLMPITIPK
jgi:predicted RNase H-like HicB family nuclease